MVGPGAFRPEIEDSAHAHTRANNHFYSARSSRPSPRVDALPVSVFGTSVAQSVAGAASVEHTVARDKSARTPEKPAARRTRPNRPDEVVVNVESSDAVRKLADNTQEEANEDRQEHGGYLSSGKRSRQNAPRKNIDLQG